MGAKHFSGRGDLSILAFRQTPPRACNNRVLFPKKVLVINVDKKEANSRYKQPKLAPCPNKNWERQLVLSHG